MRFEDLEIYCKDTLIEHLGMQFISFDNNELTATMPVDRRTHQPFKLLHGGAMLALAETLGSLGSMLLVDLNEKTVVGSAVTANHLRGTSSGNVKGVAKCIHFGNKSHIWEVNIYNEKEQLISTARVTNMVIEKRK